MLLPRVIPVLLYKDKGLVKTRKFGNPKYLGDPINTVKIFNEKETDELIFLDISATVKNQKPNLNVIKNIAEECFMPVCYGGGIRTLEDIHSIIQLGIEKVCINSKFFEEPEFVRKASDAFGSSTIVVSIDVKRNFLKKYEVCSFSGSKSKKIHPADFALMAQDYGAGEIFINSVDRDGMRTGYDIDMLKAISDMVSVPVIACGGASGYDDMEKLFAQTNVAAAAAGSIFVFHGKLDAVLISYPNQEALNKIFASRM